VVTQSFGSK